MKHIKEMFIGMIVGILITVFLLAANYYSNIEKNEVYMKLHGYELVDGEWKK